MPDPWPIEAAREYLITLGSGHYDDGLEAEGLILAGASALGLGDTEETFREILHEHCGWPKDLLDEGVEEVQALAMKRAEETAKAAHPPRQPGSIAWTRLRDGLLPRTPRT
jgi:hypothetical protein